MKKRKMFFSLFIILFCHSTLSLAVGSYLDPCNRSIEDCLKEGKKSKAFYYPDGFAGHIFEKHIRLPPRKERIDELFERLKSTDDFETRVVLGALEATYFNSEYRKNETLAILSTYANDPNSPFYPMAIDFFLNRIELPNNLLVERANNSIDIFLKRLISYDRDKNKIKDLLEVCMRLESNVISYFSKRDNAYNFIHKISGGLNLCRIARFSFEAKYYKFAKTLYETILNSPKGLDHDRVEEAIYEYNNHFKETKKFPIAIEWVGKDGL